MLRTFPEHFVRTVQSLDGLWDFLPECDQSFRGKVPKTYTRKLEVPSVWESLPDLRAYRGIGWFRRQITLAEPTHLRLAFGGVSHTATVFLDGREVGGHYDAFTPWDLVVPNVSEGEHDIVVKVDNRFGPHSALHIPNDYYSYGGISRPVELQTVPDLFIDKILAQPIRRKNGWDLDVRVCLRNISSTPQQGALCLGIAGVEMDLDEVEVAPGDTIECSIRLRNLAVEPWSAENPKLYLLNAELIRDEFILDDKCDRIGFREIKVKGHKLLLNGAELRLRGFNRHEDHPVFGCAHPVAVMAHDLDLFVDMHANFLRTSHYPNDLRLLDMCDERGIYVWEESHSRQTPFNAPMFPEQIRTSTREMVENHFNRPCIVMWGCLNECDAESEAGFVVHRDVIQQIRGLDASRPIAYATNRLTRDICVGLADFVCWNLYTGWYSMAPDKVEEQFKGLVAWLDGKDSRGGKGKPVIISEFGAGAVPGWRHPHGNMWTEEGQAHILDKALEFYLAHPRIVGAAIWQFCDVRVSAEVNPANGYNPLSRPRCMNNKGIVDEYRRPKLAYNTVKMHFMAAEAAPAPARKAKHLPTGKARAQ